jgi:hypothetical protein
MGSLSSNFSTDALNWVRNWSTGLDIRCGGHRTPPNPPFGASLYPFTTLTKLDFEGYPNYRDQRLEFNLSMGAHGWYIGYEDGEFVAAGQFTPGRKLRFDLELRIRNDTHADTFIEFVVEPNPKVGVYTGADRMRCLTGDLGPPWPDPRDARAWFEVEAHGPTEFETRGELKIAPAGGLGALVRKFKVALDTATYDASALDALWQLRWRIDRAANLDLYDDTYQVNDGANGHATEREIVVTRASLRGI